MNEDAVDDQIVCIESNGQIAKSAQNAPAVVDDVAPDGLGE
ncbi:hypothetical protein [Mycolicibacterium nivoides]|uniref:Uncharacterized protein n=1 Tax=Mycolicibacterium nivoides TaxID=2487344 RepID=A0ABW9L8A6_9MYCO